MDEDQAIAAKFDSITLFTGEEGYGKPYSMLYKNKNTDATFGVHRVHFDQAPCMVQGISLEPGQCLQLDEFEGHKRLAMHKVRLKFLKFVKERRSLRLRLTIGFPQITQFESDLVNHRLRYEAHTPRRGLLEVSKRLTTRRHLTNGQIDVVTKWIHMGTFRIPTLTGALVVGYDALKEDYTRSQESLGESVKASSVIVDRAAALGVVEEIRGLVGR